MTRIEGEQPAGGGPQAYARPRNADRRWDACNPGNVAARRELAAALDDVAARPLAAGIAVLDVGCGTGWWLERLARADPAPRALHGVELDRGRAAAAAERVPGATVERGDARTLPYPDGRFGLVTLIVVLSSLPSRADVVGALCEARRVLAPGGTIAVYEPRIPNPLNPAVRLVHGRDLDRAGLVPRDARTLTLAPPLGRRLGPLTARLHPALSRVAPLRSHRLIVHRDRTSERSADGGR